jgi:ribosomal protein S6--L-glutamate ligase
MSTPDRRPVTTPGRPQDGTEAAHETMTRPLKIAILSRDPTLYSTTRLVEAAQSRGHRVEVIDVLGCYMSITSHAQSIQYKGEELSGFDAVIPRIGTSVTFYGTAVLHQFELMGVYTLNESDAITRSRDKLRALQRLSREGFGLPITGFAHALDDSEDLIRMVGGPPLVIKLLEGSQGIGVVLADTETTAKALIETFMGLRANFLVQEYIKEAQGADLRCFVIGDRVVAAIQRQAKPGEFRSNLHRGGTASLIHITAEERSIATRAARLMGLSVAGVDILRSQRGPLVLEVNSTPGLEGIEGITGQDIADLMIQYLEENTQ